MCQSLLRETIFKKTIPLIKDALKESGVELAQLTGIAYTAGPGLSGALLVGSSIAQSLAWGLGIPALGVHHMEGHLLAPLLEAKKPDFPFVALLVSGGHTLLVEVTRIGQYKILGESLDDAVGEGFDKTAKILGWDILGVLHWQNWTKREIKIDLLSKTNDR